MSPSFDYLTQPANFDISESLIVYRAGEPYGRAILVGLLNTIKLAVVRLRAGHRSRRDVGPDARRRQSAARQARGAYVEVVRNTPLVLQLFFWIALTHTLPPVRQSLEPLPYAYLSVRGVFCPGSRSRAARSGRSSPFSPCWHGSFMRSTSAWGGRCRRSSGSCVLLAAVLVPAAWIYGEASGWRSIARSQGLQHRRRRKPDAGIRGDAGRTVGLLRGQYRRNRAQRPAVGRQRTMGSGARARTSSRAACFNSSSCRRPCG